MDFCQLNPAGSGSLSSSTASQVLSSNDSTHQPCIPLARMSGGSACVLDHDGSGRIIHRPDGSVVWEPMKENPADPAAPDSRRAKALRFVADSAMVVLQVSLAVGGAVGALATLAEVERAHSNKMCLTTRQLRSVVAHTVTSCVAGTLVGAVMGPLQAIRVVVGHLVRPAMLGALGAGTVRWVRRHRISVIDILRRLQSGELGPQLEALRALVLKAARSEAFRREVCKFGGIEMLIKMLQGLGPELPLLQQLLAQALAELMRSQEAAEAVVANGGLQALAPLLQPGVPMTTQAHALAAFSKAIKMRPDAVAMVVRESNALPHLLQLATGTVDTLSATSSSSSRVAGGKASNMQRTALQVLSCVAVDASGKAAMAALGAVPSLMDAVGRLPDKSQVQAEVISLVHTLVRGNAENVRALAAHHPPAATTLLGILTRSGSTHCTYMPAKADIHALLNVLARAPPPFMPAVPAAVPATMVTWSPPCQGLTAASVPCLKASAAQRDSPSATMQYGTAAAPAPRAGPAPRSMASSAVFTRPAAASLSASTVIAAPAAPAQQEQGGKDLAASVGDLLGQPEGNPSSLPSIATSAPLLAPPASPPQQQQEAEDASSSCKGVEMAADLPESPSKDWELA